MSKKKTKDENDPAAADLRERIATLETHVDWIKKKVESIDNRTWWILGSVVALGIMAILIALLK